MRNVYEEFSCIEKRERKNNFKKLYLFFQSSELAILLWVVLIYINNIYLVSAAAVYSLHLIMDNKGNKLPRSFYFFFWRTQKNFDIIT